MATRRRLDAELVRRGLVESRERAREAIESGRVLVAGAPTTKVSRLVDPAEAIVIEGPPPRFVGRGGHKLDGAIARFGLGPIFDGARVLDAGASTGGFTDCALQHGAAEVIAVDVGHNQLHESLRADPRVVVFERTNLRTVDPHLLGPPVEVIVADLSFISLALVLDTFVAVGHPGAVFVLLVKPQFEAGRQEVAKGRGIVTDPVVWRRVLGEVAGALEARDAAIMGAMVSSLTGTDGNVEFVLLGRLPGDRSPIANHTAVTGADLDAMFDSVVDSVPGPEGGR